MVKSSFEKPAIRGAMVIVAMGLWCPAVSKGLAQERQKPLRRLVHEALKRCVDISDITIEIEKARRRPPDPSQIERLTSWGMPIDMRNLDPDSSKQIERLRIEDLPLEGEVKLSGIEAQVQKAIIAEATVGLRDVRRIRVDLARDGSVRAELAVAAHVEFEGVEPQRKRPVTFVYSKPANGMYWTWDSASKLLSHPGVDGATAGQGQLAFATMAEARREALRLVNPAGKLRRRLRNTRLTSVQQIDGRIQAVFAHGAEQWDVWFDRFPDGLWISEVVYHSGSGDYVHERWDNDRAMGNIRFASVIEKWHGPADDLSTADRPRSAYTRYSLIDIASPQDPEAFGESFRLPPRYAGSTDQHELQYEELNPTPRDLLVLEEADGMSR